MVRTGNLFRDAHMYGRPGGTYRLRVEMFFSLIMNTIHCCFAITIYRARVHVVSVSLVNCKDSVNNCTTKLFNTFYLFIRKKKRKRRGTTDCFLSPKWNNKIYNSVELVATKFVRSRLGIKKYQKAVKLFEVCCCKLKKNIQLFHVGCVRKIR